MKLFESAKRVAELESKLADTEQKLAALAGEIESAAKENGELLAKLNKAESDLAALNESQSKLKADAEAAQKRADEAEAEKRRLASEAVNVTAGKSVPAVKDTPGASGGDNAMEILNACKTPQERTMKFRELWKSGAIAKGFGKY